MLVAVSISFSIHVTLLYLLSCSLAVMAYEQATVFVRIDKARVDQ